jgi:hypothetical protein
MVGQQHVLASLPLGNSPFNRRFVGHQDRSGQVWVGENKLFSRQQFLKTKASKVSLYLSLTPHISRIVLKSCGVSVE